MTDKQIFSRNLHHQDSEIMNKLFFQKYGNKLLIENAEHFHTLNSEIGGYVENRTHDSSKEEKWVLFRYLEFHILNGYLHFPIALCNSEQPDLLIQNAENETCGLEITESTHPLFIAARSLAEKRGKGEWPIDSCYKIGQKVSSKKLLSTLQEPNKPLRGMGWYGSEGIENTRVLLKRSIAKKLKHYSENEYQNLKHVDLLVYFTGPSGIHTSDEQIMKNYENIIEECIKETKPGKIFNNIHLLWSRTKDLGDESHPYLVLTYTYR